MASKAKKDPQKKDGSDHEDKRDAFGRAVVSQNSRKRDRSPSSSSDSSSDSDDGAPAPPPRRKPGSPPRKKRNREPSPRRPSPRRMPRRHPDRERRGRSRDRDRRSRSRSPPRRKKPKSFKEFMLKLSDDITPSKAQEEYNKYLNQFDKSRDAIFVGDHKDEDWFKEKYDPTCLEKSQRSRAEYAQKEAKSFVQDYLEGKLKQVIDKDVPDQTEDSVISMKGDNEEEVLGSGETKEKSMKKPGEFRKEIEFRGPQSDNYRDDNSDQPPCWNNQVFIQGIPLNTGREALEKVLKEMEGFQKLTLSDPMRSDRRIQNGWAQFETQEQCTKTMLSETQGGINGKRITAGYYLTLFPRKAPRNRVFYTHEIFLHPERIGHDLQQCKRLIDKFDKQNKIHSHKLFTPDTLDGLGSELQRLNFCIEYLRRVHLLCYYQNRRFFVPGDMKTRTAEQLIRNRGPDSTGQRPPEAHPLEMEIDNMVLAQMAAEDFDLWAKDWAARSREKLCEGNTKKVKEGVKYRCALCRKAFKGPTFVYKHITIKHEPIVTMYLKKQKEKEILTNYSNDKDKITTAHFRSDDRKRGRFHGGNRFDRGRNDRFNRGPRMMDAPHPQKFDRQKLQTLQPEEKVRTVKSYESVGDDLGIDDLLDFGFGDFSKGPKFNL